MNNNIELSTTPSNEASTVERVAVIRNGQGIHCRPSAVIVKEARSFDSEIEIITDTGSGDPRSAIELLSLGLDQDKRVTVRATGADAQACCDRMVELLETEFDFPPREK